MFTRGYPYCIPSTYHTNFCPVNISPFQGLALSGHDDESGCGWVRGGLMIPKGRYGYESIPMKIQFLGGWTSIYQLFWCSPGVPGFDTLPYGVKKCLVNISKPFNPLGILWENSHGQNPMFSEQNCLWMDLVWSGNAWCLGMSGTLGLTS